ncbi:MAG: anti-sigma factor antagonist, partial [Candidatus Brocadiae bacterium]|nr:anti-sigma factor antagonist [Candidatus Brocadiia bacterium]
MGNLDFQLTKEKLTDGSSVALLHMKGSIDGTTVKKFESKTLGLYEEGIKYLILNFFEIGYMNSTGLGILVKVLDKFQEKDGDVKLVKVPRKVADLFDMLGISSIVTIYPNMEDAIGSLPFPIQSATPIVPAPETLKGKSTSMPLPPKVNVAVVQPKSDDLFQDSGIVIAPDDLVGISISPEPELSIDQPAPISSEESLEGGIAIDAEWDTAPEENTNKETLSSSTAAEFFEISPMEDSISEPVETTNTNNLDMGIDLSNIGENIEATTISAEEEQSGDKSIDWNLDLGGATQETTSESPTDISNIFKEVIESSQEETTVPETLDLSDAFEEVSEAIQEEPATPEIPDLSDAFEEAAEVAQEEPATSEIPDLPEAAQEEPAAPEIPDLSEAI